MAARVSSSPSSPSLLDAISKSRWDEKLEGTPLPNALVWDTEASGPEEAVPYGSPGGWGFMDHHLPWRPEEDLAESVPPALKEAESLPSTPTGFGRDVGNLPQAVSAPRTLDSPASEVDDDDLFDFGEELEDLVVCYGDDDVEEVSEVETEDEDAGEDDDDDDDDGEEGEDEEEDEEEEDEDADGDEDEDDVEGGEVACGLVSPDPTPDCAAEEEEFVVEGNEDIDESLSSPCDCTTGGDQCTPDSERPAQDPEDLVNEAAPVAPSRTTPQQPQQPRAYTFPELTDLTKEEMIPWSRGKRTAFLHPFMLDPDDIVECAVPGSDGLPCGERFSHRQIAEARQHYREAHFPEEQQRPKTEVVCPWPGCKSRGLKFEATGRHLDHHWGMRYQCPFCPAKPIPRSDSAFRHMLGKRCKKLQAACRDPRLPTTARCEATVQPEAGPSTQRKRPARARTQQKKPQPRARAQPNQPEAGPPRGKKRSRRCVEEEEEESAQEDSEADDDDGGDSDWVPTKSDRKGKGKAPERKRKRR
ncbi:hypothetical protein V8D89_004425 [Ganoderma adspersum]